MIFSKLYSLVLLGSVATSSYVPYHASELVERDIDNTGKAADRPLIHATPDSGWMNDPNGLWYDAKEKLYHLYYQYNPNDMVWGFPLCWGHATSEDLMLWKNHGVAISPARNDSGVYSGSAVIDYNNTSGFFDDSVDPRQRVVAIWTYNTPESETQYLSYSTDGGYTFQEYEHNPVVEFNSTQFRDPKVIWHEETQKWIMTVALCQQYSVFIYSSENLKDWTLESKFTDSGLLGFQYEAPGLAKIPVTKATNNNYTLEDNSYDVKNNDTEYMWVLFLAINPGGPQGGSFNQYFIGDFNGTTFTPFTHQTRMLDFGKDFYAFQGFFNSPDDSSYLGIAWTSNWQYSAYVPTYPWRSSMSLPRRFTIQQYSPTPESVQLNLNSVPVLNLAGDDKPSESRYALSNKALNSTANLTIPIEGTPTGTFEFTVTFACNSTTVVNTQSADLNFFLKGSKDQTEYLRLGHNAQAAAFFIDRGNTKVEFVHSNPFFTNRLSVNGEPWSQDGSYSIYKVQGIVDVNILELFFNEGSMASTNTFFLSPGNFIGNIEISSSVDGVYSILDFDLKELDVVDSKVTVETCGPSE
ncbi:beta-fructofuranosidase SUC2 Ecym_1473 [Eremothecium cymbalariae DBVPG|uniref:Uncharacterized protein n=1 Tax=Eremothecium cymbalariae (strain CBS 270.75 / DBVPG 7215 / KCTC 17166 / NRRL Y-17582) TaxID=931890 RepID=G8JMI2_ERECY|nr:hypothetical protein Ecym_1473 [Eremothecium cymbalariae DBVPG\